MKYVYLFTVALFAAFSSNAQNFFFEDFDNCSLPDGWLNETTVTDTAWVFGDNAAGTPGGSVDGTCMAYFHDDDLTGAAPPVVVDLTTPDIDLSSLDTAVLRFDYIFEDLGGSYFAVALWNGADWDTVLNENTDPGCFGFFPTCGPRNFEYDLTGYLIADFKVKFIYDDGAGWNWYVGLDNVAIYVPPTDDAALTEALSPVSGCGLTATETVSVVVFNNGQSPISTIDAGFEVNAQTETETFTVSLNPGESDTLDFTVPADLSAVGAHDFTVWIDLLDDADATNDTVFFSVENIPVISTLPYMEDFESGAGGWTAGGDFSTWELGDPETAFIDTANSGVNAWVTNLDGIYNLDELSFVESPCFDFSSLTVDPVFRFAFIANSEVNWDGTVVQLSVDAGVNWSTVGNVGEGTNWYNNATDNWWDAPFGAADEWFVATHLLDGAAGEGSVKVRVLFFSDGSINGFDGFAFDDVEIFEQPSVNAGVTEILSPITGCGLGTELVTVVIENFGDADLVDFNIEYDAGSGVVTELITDTLFSTEIDTFTFAVPVDLSVTGDYDFGAWTAVVGDGDVLNDSLFTVVTSIPVVSTLPYITDFESGTDGWYSTGEEGVWELGDPEGVLIDTANSGVNAWATNLNTLNYNNGQLSYLISPCFDFSALVIDPIFEFAFISNSEANWDGMTMEVSTDAGATWNLVGNVGEGTNWYNNEIDVWWDGNTADTVGWINAEHLLDGVAGESSVIVRFVFSSDGSVNGFEGFAIDDISITEQPPVNGTVVGLLSPMTDCGLTDTEEITALVSNLGSISMDSVILSFQLGNGTIVTEVFNDTLVSNETDTFTFTSTIDLTVNGDYNLAVWVSTVGDGDTSNDTLMTMVTSVPTVNTLPYTEDFESGTGGWSSEGAINAWELGDPEGVVIDTAFSGVNAWATTLNAPNYDNDELSYLTSPCFDFSAETDDPIIQFAIQYDIEAGFDGGWLEASIDGGMTWYLVGNVGTGENWYNNPASFNVNITEAWDGVSGEAGEWVIAENILDSVAGEADVQVRFAFSTDPSVNFFEGIAVDDINIFRQPELDLVALSMDAPFDGCNLEDETVTMTFYNKGLQSVSGFELGFIVNGGTAQTETYTGTLDQGDTATYTFTTEFADLSAVGVNTIDVFTALAGDEDTSTDTVYNNEVENFGTGTPLSQTEEPEDAFISSALPEGTTSSIFFCGLPTSLDGCLEIVSVSIDSLEHTWLSDLDIFLISPAGDTLELSTDNGGSADNMSNVVFTDTSDNDITLQTVDIAPGFYHPEDSAGFAGLYNGQDPNGAWSLWIVDDTGGDVGNLLSWSMTFEDNAPVPTLNYGDTTICLTHVLTVETEMYDSYLWSTGNNTQNAQIFGDILGLGTHEIYVTVDQDGCTGISESITVTVDACAGVDELEGLSISVYPNPTSGDVILDITGESNGFLLNLMDVHGKVVYTETIGNITSALRRSIDLSNVANGIYFLRMDDGKSATTRKLIKQ